ncbi:hypothetical protein Patl1_24541 [Pistacia atlantica]|uniref:Uncharacterized protein n=1 Tax=Pistacia atlantica TaxID=434234 RepID=A0ACC1A233_9ROSI|nr:hypothetical protein Patl1_24541 [Pistacia atlantica]
MVVGPTKAQFMDEISKGLDGSTAYHFVACLQQLVHITKAHVESFRSFSQILTDFHFKISRQNVMAQLPGFLTLALDFQHQVEH